MSGAALNQDFVTYVGDVSVPIFTVTDSSGAVKDISTVSDIGWAVKREDDQAALITKKKSTGGITFVTSGTDGKFQVSIAATDTANLSGYYQHVAYVVDSLGNTTTVTVGRMQVGVKPNWTYDPTSLATNTLYQVRRLIGDTLYSDQQMQDQELIWFVNNYTNVWAAGSAAAKSLASQFSRMVDTVQGELRTLYSQRAKNYMMIAADLDRQSKGRGVAYAYAGGISNADKGLQVSNSDRVSPQFNIMMFDDLLPESPVGHQVPGSAPPDAAPVP